MSWVRSTNQLPGRTTEVLKRSKSDRTLSELAETSWYHVCHGCRQEAVKPIGPRLQKTRGDWLSHVAHHLQSVTWHGSSHLILCKINISCHGFLDASPWIKQRFLSQKSSLKVLFNESDAAFVSIDSMLAPLFFVPPTSRASYGTLWKMIMTELLKITISQSGILVSAVSAAKE